MIHLQKLKSFKQTKFKPHLFYARQYFRDYTGANSGKPSGAHGSPVTHHPYGHELLSSTVQGLGSSSFPVFCWFASETFRNNKYYRTMFVDWLSAEREYWQDPMTDSDSISSEDANRYYTWGKDVTNRVFGAGAGDCPEKEYCVLQIRNTAKGKHVWSAPIMAGFLSAELSEAEHKKLLDDIDWLYDNDICTYEKKYDDDSVSKVLWRCSVHPDHSNWKADIVTSINFGPMVFGYFSTSLPEDFWDNYGY